MKSQAAMEFMMTYGWAILIVLIVISALSFFGVLQPQRLLPATCELGPGFACKDFAIYNVSNNISIKVTNGFGKNLDIFVMYIGNKSVASSEICAGYVGVVADPFFPTTNQIFKNGETKLVYSLFPGNLAKEGLRCRNNNNCCGDNANWGHLGICGGMVASDCGKALPERGERFKQDLVIIYKEIDSTILHQRNGQLTGFVE